MPWQRFRVRGKRRQDPALRRRSAVAIPRRGDHRGILEDAETDEQGLEHRGRGTDQAEGELEVGPGEVGAGVVEDVDLGEGVEVGESGDGCDGGDHTEGEQQARGDLELDAHIEVSQDQKRQDDTEHQVHDEDDARVGIILLRTVGDARALSLQTQGIGILPGRFGQIPRVYGLLPEVLWWRADGDAQDGDDDGDDGDGEERGAGKNAVETGMHQTQQRDGKGNLDEARADNVEYAE